LDVTLVEPLPEDSPLWNLGDNVLITGHSAGLSQGHPERFCALVIRNLCRFREGETLENRVL
jgi:phosphoglycerate dehydrogenase-like enzyme